MREVVTRYFTRRIDEQKPLPDLVVIDGGKGQLSAAREALEALGLAAPDDLPREARGGDLRSRPQRVAATVAAIAGAPACCSACATRRIDSRSRTIASGARCARSPRSCSRSRASDRRSAARCSTRSAACRACAMPAGGDRAAPRVQRGERAAIARRARSAERRCRAAKSPSRARRTAVEAHGHADDKL